MRHIHQLGTCALLALTACATQPVVTDSDTAEFEQVAEAFQQLYVGGGENCDRFMPVIAEDIEMIENGEVWTYARLQEYCGYLPPKSVASTWSDRAIVSPQVAYEFVVVLYENDQGARRQETTARVWTKTVDAWQIVRIASVLGAVPADDPAR